MSKKDNSSNRSDINNSPSDSNKKVTINNTTLPWYKKTWVKIIIVIVAIWGLGLIFGIGNTLDFIGIVTIISSIIYLIYSIIKKKKSRNSVIAFIVGFILLTVGSIATPRNESTSEPEHLTKAQKAKKEKELAIKKAKKEKELAAEKAKKEKELAAEKAKKEKEHKAELKKEKEVKEKKEEKAKKRKLIAKNKHNNLKKLKDALANLPEDTNNTIVDARLDDENLSIEITLTDDALSGTDAQLRSLTKKAWNIGINYANKYAPYPEDTISENRPEVDIYDEAGNTLATTGFLGGFKFKG
ncbi:O-antigen ligase family protein [Lactobacillus sp. ESL0703]|uniref:O-antigen ligase family protein n=1 Tax=Lactobacillus sp. ESL0703 TaxID=2983218 RepID=UPI0023FA2AFF|nr:O-antigen ligase family protein [Lactobacillus sp. ESL0703]MDF7668501.1 O-antigen ligase family protein [Lactobacillus sp. ESL0703]